MNSGYYGDDALNSFIGSTMAEKGVSLAEQYIINIHTFLPSRLSVLHFYHWVFLIFTDLTTYKLYSSAVVAAALASTFFVVKAFSKDSILALLITVITLLIGIQLREYGDPVLVFHGATSISLIFLNTSILVFVKFLNHTKKIFLLLSILLFTLACLSYELIYPFFIIYFFISVVLGGMGKKHAGIYLSIFATPVIILILQNFISRLLIEVPKDLSDPNYHKAYEVSLNVGAVFLAFIKHLVASLPLSNLVLNPFGSLTLNNILPSNNFKALLVLLVLFFSIIFYYSIEGLNKQSREDQGSNARQKYILLAIYAIMLLAVPNGIIALSPKYQSEIIWGSGYVSLYFGYFGISILISMAIYRFIKKNNKKWILVGMSLFLGATAAANFLGNNKTVDVLNNFWKYPRTVAEEALQRGILSELENNLAYMFINNDYPWDVTSFIHKYSGKFLNQEQYTGAEGRFFGVKTNENLLKSDKKSRIKERFSPKAENMLSKYLKIQIENNYYYDTNGEKNLYFYDYYADSDNSGYALLASVQKAFISQENINGVASNSVKIYMRTPNQRGVYSSMSVTFLAIDPATLKPINPITIQENQFKIISQGVGWKLIEVNSEANKYLIDVKSLRLNTSQKIYKTSFFQTNILSPKDLNFKIDAIDKILHIGFSSPFENSHITFDPVQLGTEFSIVMRARLQENAVFAPYAHIAGNHPGKNNYEGFVIQKKPIGENVFDITFGNGKKWKHIIDFTLTSDKDTYIAISVKNGRVITVVDKVISSIDIGGDIQDSAMPLYLGNYIGKDRPFPGKISELLISKIALSVEALSKLRDESDFKR